MLIDGSRSPRSTGASGKDSWPWCPARRSLHFRCASRSWSHSGRSPTNTPARAPRRRSRERSTPRSSAWASGDLRGRDARELSMGERQLLWWRWRSRRRAASCMLDEPTVHLDLRHQVEVMELLVDLNEAGGPDRAGRAPRPGPGAPVLPAPAAHRRRPAGGRRSTGRGADRRPRARGLRGRPAIRARLSRASPVRRAFARRVEEGQRADQRAARPRRPSTVHSSGRPSRPARRRGRPRQVRCAA